MDINNLEIGKWYKDGNILFMPIKKLDQHPYASRFGRFDDGAYELLWFQDVRHMGFYKYLNVLYEIHNEDDRSYLYNDDYQNIIKEEDIKLPSSKDFRNAIESIFERPEEMNWRKK